MMEEGGDLSIGGHVRPEVTPIHVSTKEAHSEILLLGFLDDFSRFQLPLVLRVPLNDYLSCL
jgi:hypothetical protein